MPQFIKCRFRPLDTRLYTYVNSGDPVQPGDFVKVEDARGSDGAWKRVEVVEVDVPEPTAFVCKPILGIYNPDLDPGTAATA